MPVESVVDLAELTSVLDGLPDGMDTILGESGGLVSGGEGQRVRLARAMLRPDTRLAILDEPFRGLDRDRRRKLLTRIREVWQGITLLCITHDVSETLAFDRVLVVEAGHIIEDGNPKTLADDPDSRYRALLDAEEMVRSGLWASKQWRRLWLEDGQLSEVEAIMDKHS